MRDQLPEPGRIMRPAPCRASSPDPSTTRVLAYHRNSRFNILNQLNCHNVLHANS